jgi:ATP-dependent exoDNAse (exonuclease V) alpha subunit
VEYDRWRWRGVGKTSPHSTDPIQWASRPCARSASRRDQHDHEHAHSLKLAQLHQRYLAIAKDYLHGHEAGQQTLVVSPGNDERRDLNRTIRETLIEAKHVEAEGQSHNILVQRQDVTRSAVKYARYYNEGDVVHFERAHTRQNIARDAYLTVQNIDRTGNLLTLQYPNGRKIEVSPARWEKAVQVYTQEKREFAVGDRIEYRIHDRKHHVSNHALATITNLEHGEATLKFDDGRVLKGPLSPHIDLGYCSTSHAAQGATVGRVIINLDSMRSAQLLNQRSFYVTLSRGRDDARVYTNDAYMMRNAVKREQTKEMAIEIIPQQQPRQSTGMRI